MRSLLYHTGYHLWANSSSRYPLPCTRLSITVLMLAIGLSASTTTRALDITIKEVRRIDILSNAIAYDAKSQHIFASIPGKAGRKGNSVIPIAPQTGELEAPIPVGSEPTEMVISQDGEFLYVVLEGAREIRRVNLPNRKADLQFPISGTLTGIAIVPGNRDQLLISQRHNGVENYTSVMENGLLKPDSLELDSLAFTFSNHILIHQLTFRQLLWSYLSCFSPCRPFCISSRG